MRVGDQKPEASPERYCVQAVMMMMAPETRETFAQISGPRTGTNDESMTSREHAPKVSKK